MDTRIQKLQKQLDALKVSQSARELLKPKQKDSFSTQRTTRRTKSKSKRTPSSLPSSSPSRVSRLNRKPVLRKSLTAKQNLDSKVPKIIWGLWLNFINPNKIGTSNGDGKLEGKMKFFEDRIRHLHPSWNVQIITTVKQLYDLFEQETDVEKKKLLYEVFESRHIGGAHKSDFIRYYLLQKFGGFWIDLSTFLITSLDIYLKGKEDVIFFAMYTPSFMVEEILIQPLNDLQDSVKFTKILENVLPVQNEYIKHKEIYKDFAFLPENFFIATTPNNEIINDIYEQLCVFWSKTIGKLNNYSDTITELNKYVHELINEIFVVKDLRFAILNSGITEKDLTNKKYLDNIYKDLYKDGYIFNYLQMYISIIKYINRNHCEKILNQEGRISVTQYAKKNKEIINQSVLTNPNKQIINGFITNQIKSLCGENNNNCKSIILQNKTKKEQIYLHPLSLSRIIKWEDTEADRTDFTNTYIEKAFEEIKKEDNEVKKKFLAQALLNFLTSLGVYQIKFSSWTRNRPFANKLYELFEGKDDIVGTF